MRELEIDLVARAEHAAAVDLFDLRHARRVLAAFGRAFGTLPEDPAEPSKEQETFLDQAVAGLSQDGRVISRPAGPVRGDGQGQAVDARHA